MSVPFGRSTLQRSRTRTARQTRRECNRRLATREGIATALRSGIGFALFAWLVVFVRVLLQAKGKLAAVFGVPTVPEACGVAAITVFCFVVPLLKYWFLNARLDPADLDSR